MMANQYHCGMLGDKIKQSGYRRFLFRTLANPHNNELKSIVENRGAQYEFCRSQVLYNNQNAKN